jgi:hypothetical protein
MYSIHPDQVKAMEHLLDAIMKRLDSQASMLQATRLELSQIREILGKLL